MAYTYTNTQVTNGITIKNNDGSLVGGDKSIRTQGATSLDIQSERDAVVLDHLYWIGSITSFEELSGGKVRANYVGTIELADGNSVIISSTTNYNGTYTISNVITDVGDSFDFTATWVATETGAWTAEPLYDRLRPDENKNDNTWSLEAQTGFYAEADNSLTIGKRNKTLAGWGGDWSAGTWSVCVGYQNILGGKGSVIIGNNNIGENYWCDIIGDHNHVSEWSTRVFGNWNVGQGGDGLLIGRYNDTYGWKNNAIGNDNYVAGNESQAYGNHNILHDAYGVTLNETPDDVHNRFNIALGNSNTIGTSGISGTVNNIIAIGANNTVAVDGAVAIGKGIINTHEDSIEIGADNDSKIAVRSDGRFIFPLPLTTTEPTTADVPIDHGTLWYDDGVPVKLYVYRNIGGATLEITTIG